MSVSFREVCCTVDINMPELRYLADHLQPEECRRLVAALHFHSYSAPNSLDAAERKVSEDIPCIRLLLHWNSSKGEGRGETHEMLFRRLRQIGRHDLADWLGKTVFHQLGKELQDSLNEPFQEITSESETTTSKLETKVSNNWTYDWQPYDTICSVLIVILCVVTVVAVSRTVYKKFLRKTDSRGSQEKKWLRKHKNYEEMKNFSDTESEDMFDIRRNDPAIKLIGR